MRHSSSHSVPKNKSKYTPFLSSDDMPLLDYVMKCLDGISRNKAKAILTGNGVRVDGKTVTRHDFNVKPGMLVEISRYRGAEPEEDLGRYFGVVYEDDHLIVVDKSDGVMSVGVGHNSLNMKRLLDDYFVRTRQRFHPHLVHRLDTRTSGLMVYAKTIETQQLFIHDWRGYVQDRRYVAVVEGAIDQPEGHIESWLIDTPWLKVISSKTNNGGKWASTDWKLLRTNGSLSLVELHLHTGRKNQIRVHMHDLGYPIVGDRKYGCDYDPINRMCLHAFRLAFYHPITGELLHFETPFPNDFLRLMDRPAR